MFWAKVRILKFPTINIKTQIYTEIFRQITSSWALFWAKLQIQIKPQISENQSLYFASIRAEWRISKFPTIQIKTQSANIEEILKPKMTRSFFSLCITNAICLIRLLMLMSNHFLILFPGIESLTIISKSLIWLGFIMDSAVCFAEFMVVWLKVQAPPVYFYWLSAARYLIYTVTTIYFYWYHLISETMQITTVQFVIWCFCIILHASCTSFMICVNEQFSNEVNGINNPVAYPVGPIGKQAMAGA